MVFIFQGFKLDLRELLDIAYNLEGLEYNRPSVYQSLKTIMLCGKDVELAATTRILLQYSFIPELRKTMARDDVLLKTLKKILIYNYPNKRLLSCCDGLIWRLESLLPKLTDNEDQISVNNSLVVRAIDPFHFTFGTHKNMSGKKLFVSHEYHDRMICKSIGNELKLWGLVVTLNNEEVHDEYSFEKIALAISKSDLVIICK